MRFPMLLTLAAGAGILTGCAPVSIHALYTPQDIVADPSLEGQWTGEDGQIRIQKSGDGYQVTIFDTGHPSAGEAFNVHLLRLNGMEFLDAVSSSTPTLGISGHLFGRISLEGDDLGIALLDDGWLKEMAQAGLAPASVTGEGDGRIILTAPTSDLQRFIAIHASDPDAWDSDGDVLHRLR